MIIGVMALFMVKGYRKVKEQGKKIKFLRETLAMIGLLLVVYLVDKSAYAQPSFFVKLQRPSVDFYLLSILMPVFFIPVLFQLFGLRRQADLESAKDKAVFGYPIFLLPRTRQDFFYFTIYVIVGVIFEEIICRQFLFYYLHILFGMQGNFMVLWSSLLFALPHLYQGWRGMFSSFVLGLILGKIFLITGNIFYPICMHFVLNCTLLIKSWRFLDRKDASTLPI